ncbi:MAG: PBP1A family penicillin-binding protein [Gemmatimonadota bacterium]
MWVWAQHSRSRTAIIAAALLALAGIGPALVAFQASAVAHLDGPFPTTPTRVYARPLVLYIGMRTNRAFVEGHLGRLGYAPAKGRDVEPGEYRLGWRAWIIGRRPFRHHEGLRPGGTVMVRLDSRGRIRELEDGTDRRFSHIALEPELIGSFLGTSQKDYIPVRLSDVPELLVAAVLTIEDQRFFEHSGLDLKRIAAAALANIRAGRIVQGGSTLTQQLAKNLYLSPRRTLTRKVREAAIALALERRYSKEQILEAYLNEVYLGQNGAVAIHGVGRAAQHYFAKDVSALELSEAALLAGLIRGPSLYSPFRRPEAAKARRNLVLGQMSERRAITEEAAEEAQNAPLELTATRWPTQSTRYFVDFVREQVRASQGTNTLERAGLAVFTSLDMRLQRAAEEAVRKGLAELEARAPYLGRIDPPLQAALVAIDPRSGDILAMVGGREYGQSQFNRAVNARRQPGSAFKPVVALAALSRRRERDEADQQPFTLATVLEDERLVVSTPLGPWEPSNYDERFRGPVSLREAIERSLNVPFARLGMAVGPPRIVETARRLGIESPLNPYPSLALGSFEVTLLELTRAYGVLAAGGFRAEPRPILGVLGREGDVFAREESAGEQVYDPAEAYLVTSALRGAVERGTGRSLYALGYRGEVAAKSGTTNDFRDGWFIGYTPSLAVGVWVGFDDGRTLGLPGSRVALPIFARFLVDAVGRYGDRGPYGRAEFRAPSGLEVVEIDPRTGLLAGPGCRGRTELFLEGTAPERSCSRRWAVWGSRRGERATRLRELLQRLWEREARSRAERRRSE